MFKQQSFSTSTFDNNCPILFYGLIKLDVQIFRLYWNLCLKVTYHICVCAYRLKKKVKKVKNLLITVTYYTTSNQEHIIFIVQHINGPTINPKNSHKDLKGVLKIKFNMLQKYIKIIAI